jgi:hypothetical protein
LNFAPLADLKRRPAKLARKGRLGIALNENASSQMMRRPPLGRPTAYCRFFLNAGFHPLGSSDPSLAYRGHPDIGDAAGPALRSPNVTAASTRCAEGRTNFEAEPHGYAHCRKAGDGPGTNEREVAKRAETFLSRHQGPRRQTISKYRTLDLPDAASLAAVA